MMMRKLLMTAAIVSLAITGTGAVEAKTLKLGMGDPLESDQGALAKRFKELVEGYSGGEIEVQLFPGGALGAETEMLQNARMGSLDFALVGIGNVTPFAKELGALTMPYMIENTSDAVKLTTGHLGNKWNEIANKAGLHIVSWTYSNFRFLTNSVRPVTKLDEIRGMKVRVPQNKIMLSTYEAWGASPIAMAWPEVFTALQQGVIDGQDNPYIVNYTMKFHEVQKHVTEVHYNYSLQPLVTGIRSFSKYSDEERQMIERAGLEAQLYSLMFQLQEADKAKQGMIRGGVEVHMLEDEDQWIQIAKSKVWPQFYDEVGGKEFLDSVLKELGKE